MFVGWKYCVTMATSRSYIILMALKKQNELKVAAESLQTNLNSSMLFMDDNGTISDANNTTRYKDGTVQCSNLDISPSNNFTIGNTRSPRINGDVIIVNNELCLSNDATVVRSPQIEGVNIVNNELLITNDASVSMCNPQIEEDVIVNNEHLLSDDITTVNIMWNPQNENTVNDELLLSEDMIIEVMTSEFSLDQNQDIL